MSQTVVPAFYSNRKRFKERGKKVVENSQDEKLSDVLPELEKTVVHNVIKSVKKSKVKSKDKKVNKITNYLKSGTETSNASVTKETVQKKVETPHTPKRNLTPEELTPSKKKPLNLTDSESSYAVSPAKTRLILTPTKHKSLACKKLLLNSPTRCVSSKKIVSPSKIQLTPQKVVAYENLSNKDLASIIEHSRTKILFSDRLPELKKSLESFTNVSAKIKESQSNSSKITSVVSSSKTSEKEPAPVSKREPIIKELNYLAAPKAESSFVLPYKYKLLHETFCCFDTVVRMIHNRKEKVIFEKVKQGVQGMTKRNFLMNHLGQIMAVFPSAYTLEYQKNDSYQKSSLPYQLIITPIISEEGSVSDVPEERKKKNKQSSFICMTPQHLLERKHIFEQNLLKITKRHHQEFLKRKKFPAVPDDKILRWHPNFPVDSVPDIPVGTLPKEPKMKVCTAKDVLNKLKGSVQDRVAKALQNVAEEREASEKKEPDSSSINNEKNRKQNSVIEGICPKLLERIRARESAKVLETMTRSTQDVKRLEMIERLPKIVHILWHYFIAERKKAVPVDVAVDKIIHSFDSLSTPDAVKEHLDLIKETMPDWLSSVKIAKGEYLTMDKTKDINVMLANIK